MYWAYEQAGVKLGNRSSVSTETLKDDGVAVKGGLKNAQPGDIIFFDTYKKNGHVGIYLGDGKFIGAQSSTGVAVVDINKSDYWSSRLNGNIRRVGGGDVKNLPYTGNGKVSNLPYNGNAKISPMSNKGTVKVSPQVMTTSGKFNAKIGSYNNLWKTQKEASKASGFKKFQGELFSASKTLGVPPSWIDPLIELFGRESTWDSGVNNKKSSARGYAQFLNQTVRDYKKKYGMDYDASPVNQLILGILYVRDRYGDPTKALREWDKKGWY